VLGFMVSGLWEEMPFVRVGSWRVGACSDVRALLAGKRGRQTWDHGVLSSGQSACLIL
jgi:hypothetical protein